MPGCHIGYNPAVRFANLRTFAGPLRRLASPCKGASLSPYSYAWIGVSQLSDGLPLELF